MNIMITIFIIFIIFIVSSFLAWPTLPLTSLIFPAPRSNHKYKNVNLYVLPSMISRTGCHAIKTTVWTGNNDDKVLLDAES